ncbi:MAG: hypothetical protein ACOCVM_07020 [Desulfovibrionaceae bacterium]
MHTFRILTLLVASVAVCAATAHAGDVGHCLSGEKTIFTCQIKGKTKVVSVCASQDLGPDSGYVQYRFGKPGAIEMTYPANKAGSSQAFRVSTYTRAGTSYNSLSFKNKGVEYVVYDDYVSEGGQEEFASGVKVILPDKREVDIPCADMVRNFWEVEGVVPEAEQ